MVFETLRSSRRLAPLALLAVPLALWACTTAQDGRARPGIRPPAPGTYAVIEGRRREAAGDLDSALASFESAIAVNPELTVAYLGAGDIYRRKGNFQAAEEKYGQAAQLEPRNFDAQYLHGLSLHLLNRIAEAVRAYLRALAIRPYDVEANLNVATAYLQMGEPDQALVYGIRAVRMNGQSGPARANLGAIYAALDNHSAAVAEYQQAAELMELTPELLLNMADSLSRLGRHDEAINTLDQVIRIKPSAIAFERLGAAAFRMRDYETAIESFQQALSADRRHYPAMNGLAVCHLNEYLWSEQRDDKARQEAVRLMRESLRIEENQPRIVELLRRYN